MITGYGESRTVNQKHVYIVEEHHYVLLAWAEYRKTLPNPPLLISLDHHTDTHSAFLRYTFDSVSGRCDDNRSRELIDRIDYNHDQSILESVYNLRNDEHIDAAIKSGIISRALIVSYDGGGGDIPLSIEVENWMNERHFNDALMPTRPYTYRQSDIYIPENLCAIGCEGPHDDQCVIPHFNQAIESCNILLQVGNIIRL